MTTRVPTGRVRSSATGPELVYVRTFRAPIEDVWASITESDRTARWFASWSGEPGPGRTIDYRLVAEEGEPSGRMLIEECEPPVRLRVSIEDDAGTWALSATLREEGGVTELEFVHRSAADVSLGDIGPGWEYYLDRLVAAFDDAPMPDFDDYYPYQQAYFEAQQASTATGAGSNAARTGGVG